MCARSLGDANPPIGLKQLDDLPRDEARELKMLAGGDEIQAVADSDMLFSGQYGQSRLVLCAGKVLTVEDGVIERDVRLDDVASAHCKDYVGNGVLEVRREDGRRVELIRYSKTLSDVFSEAADRINERVGVGEEELEARQEQIAQVAGGADDTNVYRCPNCGHPLKYASDACPKCTSKRQVMFRLTGLMNRHWKLAIGCMLLSVFFTVCQLGPGILVRELVDKALRPVDETGAATAGAEAVAAVAAETDADTAAETIETRYDILYVIVGAFFGLITVQAIINHFRIRAVGTIGQKLVADLRLSLYRTLQRLSLSYYDREHTGRIMSRVLTDTRMVQQFVVAAVQQMVIDFLLVVGISIALFAIHWKLAAIALLPMPGVVLLAKFFSTKFRGIFRSVRRKFATLSASVSESISGMRVVKSFAQEEREIAGFNEKNLDVYNAHLTAVTAKSRFNPAVSWLTGLGVLAVWFFGGADVIETNARMRTGADALTLGTLMLFITYMTQFYQPLRRIMNLTETFQASATAAERIFNIMDMPSDVGDHDNAIALKDVKGRIEIKNVSFGYNEGERVLKDINLTIEPGEMVGLVGQTGSGKSTLVSLICRFYDPTRGEILLDGVSLSDIRTKSLRDNIGMVLQDPFLFAGTVKENIAYGRPQADELDIIRAARAANAHEFIMNLPDGYDSEVGERGVMLSGGEKQRISIARAILKDPAILILDEATSAVDTATEASIQEAMDRLVHGRTTVAIAHRLSTLRNAHRLVVLADGEIIEEGTHEDLLNADGTYAKLCRIQAEFASGVPT